MSGLDCWDKTFLDAFEDLSFTGTVLDVYSLGVVAFIFIYISVISQFIHFISWLKASFTLFPLAAEV